MTDAGSLLDGLRALNAVDITLLAWLGYAAFQGMRRGLVGAVLRLAGLGVAVAIGATQYWRVLGPVLDADVWLVSGAFADVVAFIVTVVIARIGTGLVARALSSAWKSTGGQLPVLGIMDTLLGAIPGLVRGAVVGAIAVMPLRGLALVPAISETVMSSVVAGRLLDFLGLLVPPIRAIVGI